MELDFSFGMRRYQVLITKERGALPTFNRSAGRYVMTEVAGVDAGSAGLLSQPLPGSKTEKDKMSVVKEMLDRPGGAERRPVTTGEWSREGRNSRGALPEDGGGITLLQRLPKEKLGKRVFF